MSATWQPRIAAAIRLPGKVVSPCPSHLMGVRACASRRKGFGFLRLPSPAPQRRSASIWAFYFFKRMLECRAGEMAQQMKHFAAKPDGFNFEHQDPRDKNKEPTKLSQVVLSPPHCCSRWDPHPHTINKHN